MSEIEALIKSVTGMITAVSGILTLIAFLQGFAENSYSWPAVLTFIISWYILVAISEELHSSLKGILVSLGIPFVVIALMMAIASLFV